MHIDKRYIYWASLTIFPFCKDALLILQPYTMQDCQFCFGKFTFIMSNYHTHTHTKKNPTQKKELQKNQNE